MIVSKNKSIKDSLAITRQRRKSQDCKVFELKFDLSHLSNAKFIKLNNVFKETKWLYNHILSLDKETEDFDIFRFNPLIKKVNILDQNKQPLTRELNIGSQIKQATHSRMLDSIKALSVLKKKGHKVGSLKFKSRINSIPLKQFGVTYRFNPTKKNYIKIQGIKGYFKISGARQIPANAEFANATLVKRGNDFYLLATTFIPKEQKKFKHESVGIDFGIESTITLSNGEKFKVNIPENKRTKKLRKNLSRKQGSKKKSKKSKSYLKNLNLVNKSVKHTVNKKKDVKNKIVSYVVNTFETVCIQDESIKEWKDGLFGKQVHNSILGGIMRDLKIKSHTLKIVDKYTPTTQPCLDCGKLNKFPLSVRTYECSCGYKEDRDIHVALAFKRIAMGTMNSFHTEYMELKILVEGMTTSSRKTSKSFPLKPEAHDFSRG
jgi:transposase